MSFTPDQREQLDNHGYNTDGTPNVGVHFGKFPDIHFELSLLPVGHELDKKGGKVCSNLKEAREYATQQFNRLITQEHIRLYAKKAEIETMDVRVHDPLDDGAW